MDPRPAGLNRREVPMHDGRVIVLRVYAMPPEIRDGIAAALAEGERRERRRHRHDVAAAIWHAAIAGLALIVLAVLLTAK